MIPWASLLGAIVGAYFIGALPVGYWIARWAGIQDIRHHGSGNSGATNVARTLGTHFFFIVLFFDAFKAFAYIRIMNECGFDFWPLMLCAYALLFGNAYSFLLNGSGGKGMATFVGILLALNPWLCITLVITWLGSVVAFKNIGIASVFTAFMLPWYALLFTNLQSFLFLISVAAWIAWRHQDNVRVYYAGR